MKKALRLLPLTAAAMLAVTGIASAAPAGPVYYQNAAGKWVQGDDVAAAKDKVTEAQNHGRGVIFKDGARTVDWQAAINAGEDYATTTKTAAVPANVEYKLVNGEEKPIGDVKPPETTKSGSYTLTEGVLGKDINVTVSGVDADKVKFMAGGQQFGEGSVTDGKAKIPNVMAVLFTDPSVELTLEFYKGTQKVDTAVMKDSKLTFATTTPPVAFSGAYTLTEGVLGKDINVTVSGVGADKVKFMAGGQQFGEGTVADGKAKIPNVMAILFTDPSVELTLEFYKGTEKVATASMKDGQLTKK